MNYSTLLTKYFNKVLALDVKPDEIPKFKEYIKTSNVQLTTFEEASSKIGQGITFKKLRSFLKSEHTRATKHANQKGSGHLSVLVPFTITKLQISLLKDIEHLMVREALKDGIDLIALSKEIKQ